MADRKGNQVFDANVHVTGTLYEGDARVLTEDAEYVKSVSISSDGTKLIIKNADDTTSEFQAGSGTGSSLNGVYEEDSGTLEILGNLSELDGVYYENEGILELMPKAK